jgi:hypothetical protein
MSKSILEEALLQVSQLEEAVKNNAQEILASTMKEEIDELVRESMEDTHDEEVAEEVSEETDMAIEEESTEEVELDEQIEDADDEDESEEEADEEEGEDMPEDEDVETEDLDSDLEDIEMPSLELPSLEDIEDMSDEMSDDDEDEVIDLTGASDEEILKVFKAMGEEDGIIVAKDEDGTIHLEDGDDEYRIEMDDEKSEESEEEFDMEMVSEEVSEEEEVSESDEEEAEVVYEIEIDEEESMEEESEEMVSEEEVAEEVTEEEEMVAEEDESEEDMEEEVEGDVDEAARTLAADARKPADQGKKFKAGRKDLSEDVQTLQAKNAELTEALKLFRNKLNEVGVFNSNLAYATRLFTEHTTTKQEKLNILKRFDSVESLKESKALYNTIKDELAASNEKLNENVANKISNSPQSGSSEKLVESKAYENPQVRRIKEMMGILK